MLKLKTQVKIETCMYKLTTVTTYLGQNSEEHIKEHFKPKSKCVRSKLKQTCKEQIKE